MLKIQRSILLYISNQSRLPSKYNSLLRSMASEAPPPNVPLVIKYVEGDLFSCPAHASMAHCVSEDLKMGKGIAVLFKNKFKRLDELRSQKAKTGQCAILEDNDRFIYYLVTKPRYFAKPTYKSIRSSLEAVLHHCLENNVKEMSMPKIGSGLDRLDWKKVKDIIEDTFSDTGMQITVYIYK